MAAVAGPWQPVHTYVRWRPLADDEQEAGEFDRSRTLENNSLYSVTIQHPKHRPWKSGGTFKDTYEPADVNLKVFDSAVAQALPRVLEGACCNFFAYGHTGSGKTHTIIGYDYEHDDRLGVCLAAARRLFDALDAMNQSQLEEDSKFCVGFSLFELRKHVAFDLLNERTQCHIRQGADGRTHIRGPTEMLEDGKVRVQPIVKRPCWTFESLRDQLQECLGLRAVGSSSVHDQSSRTHAVLELEIINTPLIAARQAVIDRQSELVPIGKRATDITLEETMKGLTKGEDGQWRTDPTKTINQALIDSVKAEQAEHEARVIAAEEHVASILAASSASTSGSGAALGGKLIFVDLAGSEYQHEKGAVPSQIAKQTPQERQESRQINTDLLALKEVIRAFSAGQSHIPFRSSPLTMVLREHFLGSREGSSAMIVTVSPASEQYPATLNSLKYGSLVGAASA